MDAANNEEKTQENCHEEWCPSQLENIQVRQKAGNQVADFTPGGDSH
jgi:hypothetical protein